MNRHGDSIKRFNIPIEKKFLTKRIEQNGSGRH